MQKYFEYHNKSSVFLFKKTSHICFLSILFTLFIFLTIKISGCSTITGPFEVLTEVPQLTQADVEKLVTQAVEQADRLNKNILIGITDREGNVLAIFRMTGAIANTEGVAGVITKARSAAYLSSNQHGFTTVTACFITRKHFPPGVLNTPGGPLFGVPMSSLPGGDVQPNGSGLTGVPGGVPIFKNGLLAGAIGISGALVGNELTNFLIPYLNDCNGINANEAIARGAVIGFEVSSDKQGDNIFLDGIRLKFANTDRPAGNFTLRVDSLETKGNFDTGPIASLVPKFPIGPGGGEVDLGDGLHNYRIKPGMLLSADEVRTIINNAVAQANKTRAAIRRPIGTAARVFVTVVDTNGAILGIWRTPDATLFSYDVSAQKARTVLAFSRADRPLGQQVRNILGLQPNQPLAMTARAVGFLAQNLYPPGIDRDSLGFPIEAGPLFTQQSDPITEFEFQRQLGLTPFGNGITIFPGGIPLYKNGQIVGAIGVSGDGVDQDDIITFAGTKGFEPPPEIRCDQFFYKGVRLPFVKFPRQPELD